MMPAERAELTAARLQEGNLYLDRKLCMPLVQASCVALLYEQPRLWLVPLQSAGGGQLLKRRNARGDRVLHLQAFLRDNALNENTEADCPAYWDTDKAALLVTLPGALYEDL